MRFDEANTVVPLDSPEMPPAMSYAAVRSSFPCLSLCQAGPARQSLRLRREPVWAASRLGRASACFVGRRVLRADPAVELGFQIRFCFILLTDLCIDSKICIS